MRSRGFPPCAACLLLATTAVGGCCLTPAGARALREDILARNRLRAEPAMQAAARQAQAELLPLLAQEVVLPSCDEPPPVTGAGMCFDPKASVGPMLAVRDPRGRTWKALSVPDGDLRFARLARRRDMLFVLRPRLSPREVGSRTECECDGMPHPILPTKIVFMLEDGPNLPVQDIEVPVVEDYITWTCKGYAV